jgi:hypothetical protein
LDGKVVVVRSLLVAVVAGLSLVGVACTTPSYRKTRSVAEDAGSGQAGPDGGTRPSDAGIDMFGEDADSARPSPGDGSVAPNQGLDDAAAQSVCIVGASRIGECKLR